MSLLHHCQLIWKRIPSVNSCHCHGRASYIPSGQPVLASKLPQMPGKLAETTLCSELHLHTLDTLEIVVSSIYVIDKDTDS